MIVFCCMEEKKDKIEDFTVDKKLNDILLEGFYVYHLLTPEQISRLLYSPGNVNAVTIYLRDLLKYEYVYRFKMPTSQGVRPFIYTLAKEGRKYISEDEELDKDVFYIPDGQEQKNYLRLMHFLELNDFLIDAKLLEKKRSDIELFDMQHDVLLQKEPVLARTSEGEKIKVTPDGILEFRVTDENLKRKRVTVWVELDRGWHSIRKFKKKIREILTIHETGVDLERFGTSRIIYAFPTTAGEKRVEKMRMWTRQEIGSVDKGSWINRMFCFAAVPALNDHTKVDVETLFCSPVWSMPYGENDECRALIEI
jgi:Replication-relaxation